MQGGASPPNTLAPWPTCDSSLGAGPLQRDLHGVTWEPTLNPIK